MDVSAKAQRFVSEMARGETKLGDIKKWGKEIKKDHDLAMEFWSTGGFSPRLLAILVLDKKLLAEGLIDQLMSDMLGHDEEERNQLADWLLANQLMTDRKLTSILARRKKPIAVRRKMVW